MKQTILSLLLLTSILVSCKKNKYDPDIIQYDDDQIKAYIAANGLTGMIKDTSGMYYKIISPGTGPTLQYTDSISMVYTNKSLDGNYVSADTLQNHFENFIGHINSSSFPFGLQEAVHNILNHRGGAMRLLIPSHLAYGVSGIGTGSSTITSGRIAGNQSLDYYIHIIDNQDTYDQSIIKNYIAVSTSPSSWKSDPSGIWYYIATAGTGTVPITDNSTVTATFTLSTLNGIVVSQYNTQPGTSIEIPDIIKGMQIGLKKYATTGALMSFLIPSSLAYGKNISNTTPANSCVRYDIQILDVSP
jgi:FKBP-type peptidyl-prolyl cis-trans isomerase FkpA